MEQQKVEEQQQMPMKRNAATTMIVFYKDREGAKDVVVFDFMPDFDKWLASTNVEILNVWRGVEKKFTVKTKVILA